MKKSKTVLFFGPLAAAALLLASCGSSSGISPDKSASKGTAGGATTTAADADTNPTGTAASKATTSAVSATTASSDCAQLVSNAKLVVYSLSDYCESTDPANPAPRADGGTIEALRKAGATVDSCPDNKGFRAYLTNKILLSPDNLANRNDLASHIPEVLGANTTVTDWQSNDSGVAVGTVTNSTQPLAPDGLLALQGDNYFVDVDWLGSASTTSVPNPNWTFRPGGPPEAATDPKLSTAAAKDSSVAVFDTPAVSGSSDIEANNKLDEMYGHGEFVSDLIYRHSGATANLRARARTT